MPSGRINPLALEVLRNADVSVEGLRSKSWDEFADTDPDPSSVSGDDSEKRRVFEFTGQAIADRMSQLLELPLGSIDRAGLATALAAIGRS